VYLHTNQLATVTSSNQRELTATIQNKYVRLYSSTISHTPHHVCASSDAEPPWGKGNYKHLTEGYKHQT